MLELMAMLAKALPFDDALKMLEDQITEYKKQPTDENKQKIATRCALVSSNILSEKKTMDEVYADATHLRKLSERFTDEKISS